MRRGQSATRTRITGTLSRQAVCLSRSATARMAPRSLHASLTDTSLLGSARGRPGGRPRAHSRACFWSRGSRPHVGDGRVAHWHTAGQATLGLYARLDVPQAPKAVPPAEEPPAVVALYQVAHGFRLRDAVGCVYDFQCWSPHALAVAESATRLRCRTRGLICRRGSGGSGPSLWLDSALAEVSLVSRRTLSAGLIHTPRVRTSVPSSQHVRNNSPAIDSPTHH